MKRNCSPINLCRIWIYTGQSKTNNPFILSLRPNRTRGMLASLSWFPGFWWGVDEDVTRERKISFSCDQLSADFHQNWLTLDNQQGWKQPIDHWSMTNQSGSGLKSHASAFEINMVSCSWSLQNNTTSRVVKKEIMMSTWTFWIQDIKMQRDVEKKRKPYHI